MVGDPVLDSGLGGSREPKGTLPGTWVRSTVTCRLDNATANNVCVRGSWLLGNTHLKTWV